MHPAAETGRSVRCDRCGGVVALVGLAPHVTCAFCRHTQAVPPPLLAELTRYHAQRAEHGAGIAAHDQADHAHRVAEANNPLSVGALILAYGPVLLFGGVNELTKTLQLLDVDVQRDVDGVVQGLSGLWLVVGTFGYVAYRRATARRRPRGLTDEGLGSTSCPSCGAPNALSSGRIVTQCLFCAAAIAPHAAVMQRGLDAARVQERRARLERLRTERGSPLLIPSALDGVIELTIFVLGALLSLLAGHFLPILVIANEPSVAPYALVLSLAGWLLGVLGAVAAVIGVVLGVRRWSAWQLAHAGFSERLGAARTDAAGALRWLNTYWAGPFHTSDLALSQFGAAFTTTVDGFPVLVLLDAAPERKDRSPRMYVYVASIFGEAPPPVGGDLRTRLAERGFHAQATDGGLWARANDEALRALHRDPRTVFALSWIPGAMVASIRAVAHPAPAW